MWQTTLYQTLYEDALPLGRMGASSTAKSLNYLCRLINKAMVFELNAIDSLPAPETRPNLFIQESNSQNFVLQPLPQEVLLLEYTAKGQERAALLTDLNGRLEVYIFRYDQAKGRWIWPLIGLGYGPKREEFYELAIYEPKTLSKLSSSVKTNLLRDFLGEMSDVLNALTVARNMEQPPRAAKKTPKEAPSFVPSNRIKHQKGSTRKGSRRF